jgi:hypothetical protein
MSDICPTCNAQYDYDYVYDTKGDFVRVKMCECGEFPIEVITPAYLNRALDRFTMRHVTCPVCTTHKPILNFTNFITTRTVVQCRAVFLCCNHTEGLTIMRPRTGKKDS